MPTTCSRFRGTGLLGSCERWWAQRRNGRQASPCCCARMEYAALERGILTRSAVSTRRNEAATMYAVIRAYTGNSDLADTLAEHEEEIRQLISGINGFKAYS